MTTLYWKMLLPACAICFTAMAQAGPAPDFDLPRLDANGSVTLSSLRGKVVYLDFWASWCTPCALSLPALEKVRDVLHQQGFEVVAINLDESTSDARQFISRLHVSYPVLMDPAKQTPKDYAVNAMPVAFLIDRKGNIRFTHKGFRRGDDERLLNIIQPLLQEKP